MNADVSAVMNAIDLWEESDAIFWRDLRDGIHGLGPDWGIRFRRSDGTIGTVHLREAEAWSKRVARISAEAKKRKSASDFEWFFWLGEFAGMKYETALEQFSDIHTRTIELAGKKRAALAVGRKEKAPEAKKAEANKRHRLIEQQLNSGISPKMISGASKSTIYRVKGKKNSKSHIRPDVRPRSSNR